MWEPNIVILWSFYVYQITYWLDACISFYSQVNTLIFAYICSHKFVAHLEEIGIIPHLHIKNILVHVSLWTRSYKAIS